MSIIYLSEPGSVLEVGERQFRVINGRGESTKIPINQVSAIVLFDGCDLSKGAVRMALSGSIPVVFIGDRGYCLGRAENNQNYCTEYLARQQECALDSSFTKTIAQSLLQARLHNSCILLVRLYRSNSTTAVHKAIKVIKKLIEYLPLASTTEILWKYQAKAVETYFPALASFLPYDFHKISGNQPPAADYINSLLNLGYALLSQNIYAFVQSWGLHPDFGNLHSSCHNHLPLVCDLMEQFRAPMVEELIVDLVAGGYLTINNFFPDNKQKKMYLYPDALKEFIKHWEEKLQTLFKHPYYDEVSYRQCLELQVQEYIAYLMGEIEFYRPLLMKP